MRPKSVPGGAWSECAGLHLNYDFNYKSELPNYERSVSLDLPFNYDFNYKSELPNYERSALNL